MCDAVVRVHTFDMIAANGGKRKYSVRALLESQQQAEQRFNEREDRIRKEEWDREDKIRKEMMEHEIRIAKMFSDMLQYPQQLPYSQTEHFHMQTHHNYSHC